MKRLISVIASALCAISINAATIHVPADQPTIQAGINAAGNGDTVLVAPGTYTGNGNRDIDFGGKGVVLKSENDPDSTIIDCEGSASEPHRGFYFHSGEDSTTVVEGFTIRNGYGLTDSPFPSESVGGGIKCDSSSSPMLISCIISENLGGGNGGGFYCENSSPTLRGCFFLNNAQDFNHLWSAGGAMYCKSSAPVLTNCTFTGNVSGAFQHGGGIYCEYSSLILNDCVFSGNVAGGNGGAGGGIYCTASTLTLDNCSFSTNQANFGGGIYSAGDSATLSNCTFSENYVYDDTPPVGGWGAGMYCGFTFAVLTNCTFSSNGGAFGYYQPFGGGLYVISGSISLDHCIIAFSSGSNAIECSDPPTVTLTCCDIYGNEDGDWVGCIADQAGSNGNFSLAPLFCDTANGDFHVFDNSPCAPANNSCSTLIGALEVGCTCCVGIRGNVDGNPGENINVADLTYLVEYLFFEGPVPPCPEEGNIDSSGGINVADLTYLVEYLFFSGPAPPPCR